MNGSSPITMKDIARELGVSIATVSRALHDSPRISPEQRQRIQDYARQHDFTPNMLAAQLRHSRVLPMKVIGVIVPELVHYYFSTILKGIEEEAEAHGYRIMVAQSGENYEREVRLCKSFMENKVCGVIVSQAKDTMHYEHFERLRAAGLPLVFYDRICTGLNTSRVVVDDYKGAFNAVTHLVKTGCRRIAYLGSALQLEIAKNRYNGYKDALLAAGLPFDERRVRIADTRQQAEQLVPSFFEGDDYPDAFFAVNDDTAIGILYTVKRMGLRVPEDISICGFTNGERAIACDPMLTTVEQRGTRVGQEAASILIDHVEGRLPLDHVEKRIVRTRLVLRGTTR